MGTILLVYITKMEDTRHMENQIRRSCDTDHHGHLCMLRSNGLHGEIAGITSDPKFYCFTCGGEANCADNLCEPAKIE
jgi:hypothetical protein